MKKTVLLIVLTLVFSTLNSCTEDDPGPTKTALLTNGMWIGTTQETYIDDVLSETHPIPFLRYEFKSDNTVLFDNNDDGIFETNSWSFQSNETKLKIGSTTGNLLLISNSRLVFSVEFAPSPDLTGEWIQTFEH